MIAAVLLGLLALTVGRSLSQKKKAQEALKAEQASAAVIAAVELASTDVVTAKTMLLDQVLAISGQKPLIMVHPGLAGDAEIAALDAVVETRPQEHAYLMGDDFARDLEAAGRHIARFGDLA